MQYINSTLFLDDLLVKGVVFPPQPWECFLCYESLDLVPEYCWPEYFHLRVDNITDTTMSNGRNDTVSDGTKSKQDIDEMSKG